MNKLDNFIMNGYIDSSLVDHSLYYVLKSDLFNPSNYVLRTIENTENLSEIIHERKLKTNLSHQMGKPLRLVARVIARFAIFIFIPPVSVLYHAIYGSYFTGRCIYEAKYAQNGQPAIFEEKLNKCFSNLIGELDKILNPHTNNPEISLKHKFGIIPANGTVLPILSEKIYDIYVRTLTKALEEVFYLNFHLPLEPQKVTISEMVSFFSSKVQTDKINQIKNRIFAAFNNFAFKLKDASQNLIGHKREYALVTSNSIASTKKAKKDVFSEKLETLKSLESILADLRSFYSWPDFKFDPQKFPKVSLTEYHPLSHCTFLNEAITVQNPNSFEGKFIELISKLNPEMTEKEIIEALDIEENFSNFDARKRDILAALHTDKLNSSLHGYANNLRPAIDNAIRIASNNQFSLN